MRGKPCGKITYTNRSDAVVVIAGILRRTPARHRDRHRDMEVYWCERCRGFHVGHARQYTKHPKDRRRRAVAARNGERWRDE